MGNTFVSSKSNKQNQKLEDNEKDNFNLGSNWFNWKSNRF